MAKQAELEKKLRDEVMSVIIHALGQHYDLDEHVQIEFIDSGTITIPLVDEDGNDKWPTVKVAIPRGTRNGEGGYTPFDGHDAAEAYREEQASKAQEKAVKKAMKEAEKSRKKSKDESEDGE
jgi:hypothetical protein